MNSPLLVRILQEDGATATARQTAQQHAGGNCAETLGETILIMQGTCFKDDLVDQHELSNEEDAVVLTQPTDSCTLYT